MAKLTEAEMIARYDAMKDGSLYTKPASLLLAVADFIDTPISPIERKAIAALYPDTPISPAADEDAVAAWIDDNDTIAAILEEMDGGESDPHFDQVINQMATLPDALRERVVVMLESFLASESLDFRFDRAVDNLDDLPEARRAAGISLAEGFLAGVAIARLVDPTLFDNGNATR